MMRGLAVCLLMMQPVMAAGPESISDFDGCRAIVADTERLLCYDTVADGGIYGDEQLQQLQKESFGTPDEKPDVSPDQVTVTVVRVQQSATGIYYFYTDDDAVWKQGNRGGWTVKAPFQATIKKGMLGSYFLVTDSGKSVRVKRVR